MFAIKCTILVVFGLHVRSQVFASDWVKLLPIQPVGDSMQMHSDHLSDSSPLRQRTTTKHPDLHRVGLAAESHHHSVNPIKYADLEHIVGPGFEKDLERYYNQHKHELDESTRRTPKPSEGHHFQTYDPSNDPWSIYDKPINFKTTSNSSDSAERGGDRFSLFDSDVFEKPTIVSFITKPSISTLKSVTTAKPVHSNSSATKHTKPKYFKLVQLPVGYQQVPTSSSLFGFPSILQFFRRFQNSLVTNTARSIQDKIKMLESFRDDLMSNIKNRIGQLWPTRTERSKRSFHEASDSHHEGTMDFPSSEGALMTISFLTFAVFLIKLVLQVINTIKSKHYSYNSFDTINGNSVSVTTIKENRNARSLRHVHELPMDDDDPLLSAGSKLSVGQILVLLPANHKWN